MRHRGTLSSALVIALLTGVVLMGGRLVAERAEGRGAVSLWVLPTTAPNPDHVTAPENTTPDPTPRPPRPVVVDAHAYVASPRGPAPPGRAPGGQPDIMRLTGSDAVALTFDDGPHPAWTPQVLDLLARHRVKATFCVVGTQVRQHPDLVARIAREGHTLCNHSWHHEFHLGTRSAAHIRANLSRTNEEIRRAAPGVAIPYFRHPGGNWTPRAVRVAAELDMVSLGWDVDPQDWNKPTAAKIHDRVVSQTRPGSIVLLHDGGGDRSATVAACRDFLGVLARRHPLVALP